MPAGKQILLLFAVLPLSLLLLGASWKADSVAICCASALFASFGILLTETCQALPATPPQEMMLVGLASGVKKTLHIEMTNAHCIVDCCSLIVD